MNEQDDLVELEALFRDSAGEWFLYGWDGNRIANVLKAALSAAAKPVEPEGWKLVPVEPTPEMVSSAMKDCGGIGGGSCGEHTGVDGGDMCLVWAAMLAAAPSAPGAEQAKPAEAMTEREIQSLVTEYGPQSDDEEIGFRDGIRTAQRHLAAAWGVKLEGGEA